MKMTFYLNYFFDSLSLLFSVATFWFSFSHVIVMEDTALENISVLIT